MAGRCTNDELTRVTGVNKLTKSSKVIMSVLNDLDTCTCVNTKSGIGDGSVFMFNPYMVPEDAFNCAPDKCRNTGTLMGTISSTSDTGRTVSFPVRYDATEFYAGILTLYVYASRAGTYVLTIRVGDISEIGSPSTTANADVYLRSVTFTEAGFKPIVIDLADTPSSVTGDGWQATTQGAYVRVTVPTVSATTTFGISSICFHDDTTDFQTADAVIATCLTDLNFDFSGDPTDATCFGQGYDSTTLAVEFGFTATAFTPNFWKLNPLEQLGDATEGWYPAIDRREVQAISLNGKQYGYVQLPEITDMTCGFLHVSLAETCDVMNGELARVYSPYPMNIDERQFQLITSEFTEINDKAILVHNSLVGMDLIIDYPRRAEVEEYIATDSNINKRRVNAAFTVCYEGGTIDTIVMENVIVTAFPLDPTESDETSFAMTFSVQRDKINNAFYRRYRVTDKL